MSFLELLKIEFMKVKRSKIVPQDKMLDLLEKVLMLMNTANKQKDS